MKNSQMGDVQKAQNQLIDELNAEVLLLKTKLRGMELSSSPSPVSLSSPLSASPFACPSVSCTEHEAAPLPHL